MVKIMKESSLPVEMLFNDNNIKILTGVTSSALLNAKRNNKVAISFIKYLNEDHPIIDIYQKNEILMPINSIELKNCVINALQ